MPLASITAHVLNGWPIPPPTPVGPTDTGRGGALGGQVRPTVYPKRPTQRTERFGQSVLVLKQTSHVRTTGTGTTPILFAATVANMRAAITTATRLTFGRRAIAPSDEDELLALAALLLGFD